MVSPDLWLKSMFSQGAQPASVSNFIFPVTRQCVSPRRMVSPGSWLPMFVRRWDSEMRSMESVG